MAGFFEDLAKNIALAGAVEASKDKNGKPDPYKAAGMAMGMGNFSFEDQMRGASLTGEPVTVDGNIITGQALGAGIPFALTLIKVLVDEETAKKVAEGICFQ